MTISAKAQKVLNDVESQCKDAFEKLFVKIIMEAVPMIDNENIKIPCKEHVINRLEKELNHEKNLVISGMIYSFISEQYKKVK